MKILIAGDGKVGAMLTRQLSSEGYDITLIDSNKKVLDASVEHFDVMTVQGNCASMDILLNAGVGDADLLIAATGADEVNLLCCLTAHGINPNIHTIARIRNPEYTDQIYKMRDMFALSMTVNPEKQAAIEIERLLRYPGFLKRDTFAKGRVEIVELQVERKSKLCDLTLSEMYDIAKCNVLVCAVLRNGKTVSPDGSFVLREGDLIFVTAQTEDLEKLLKSLGIITHKVSRVMLVGGGRVSYYLAHRLRRSGVAVGIIENDYERCLELARLLPSVSIIHGDGSDTSVLESEELDKCDALVTMTGIDEMNIIVSLYGKNRGVPQIITKLSRMESSNILSNMMLGSVICPKELCCNTITRYVRAMYNKTGVMTAVYSIAGEQAEAMEFIVDGDTLHCGEPLKNIKLKKNVLIACIARGTKIEIANGDSAYEPGDSMIIVTSEYHMILHLNEIFA